MSLELGRSGYRGDILAYTRTLVEGAYVNLADHLAHTCGEIEERQDLGLAIVRNFFGVDFVSELVDEAEKAGFEQLQDDPDRSQATIPLDVTSNAVQGFAQTLRFANPTGIVSIYSNRYTPSREGGKVHADTGSSTPVAIVGSGEGFTRVARSVRRDPLRAPTRRERTAFSMADPREIEDVWFGDGDLLVFDGRDRLHQGRAASARGEPRITVVGYSLRYHRDN